VSCFEKQNEEKLKLR